MGFVKGEPHPRKLRSSDGNNPTSLRIPGYAAQFGDPAVTAFRYSNGPWSLRQQQRRVVLPDPGGP